MIALISSGPIRIIGIRGLRRSSTIQPLRHVAPLIVGVVGGARTRAAQDQAICPEDIGGGELPTAVILVDGPVAVIQEVGLIAVDVLLPGPQAVPVVGIPLPSTGVVGGTVFGIILVEAAGVAVAVVSAIGTLVVTVVGAGLPPERSRVAGASANAAVEGVGIRVAAAAGAGLACDLAAVKLWVGCLVVVIPITRCAAQGRHAGNGDRHAQAVAHPIIAPGGRHGKVGKRGRFLIKALYLRPLHSESPVRTES